MTRTHPPHEPPPHLPRRRRGRRPGRAGMLPDRVRAVLLALATMLPATVLPARAEAQAPPAAEAEADQAPLTWGIRPSGPTGPADRDAFDYMLAPGATVDDDVGVSNFTDQPLELVVYATDAFTNPGRHYDLLPAAEEPSDVGTWVAFTEGTGATVTVPPRSRVDIPFRLTVPDRATPGDHAGGIVASLVTVSTDAEGNAFTVDRRVAARIYLRVSGDLAPAAAVGDVGVASHGTTNPAATGHATVTYTVTNTGNARLAGTPTVEVAGPFGFGRQRVAGPAITELLPGDTLTFTTEVPSVAPLGRLTARVQLTPEPLGVTGAETVPPAAASATTWAIPWPQLATLAVVAVLVTLARRRRRRRRDALEAQLAAAREEGLRQSLATAAGDTSPDDEPDFGDADDVAEAGDPPGHAGGAGDPSVPPTTAEDGGGGPAPVAEEASPA